MHLRFSSPQLESCKGSTSIAGPNRIQSSVISWSSDICKAKTIPHRTNFRNKPKVFRDFYTSFVISMLFVVCEKFFTIIISICIVLENVNVTKPESSP